MFRKPSLFVIAALSLILSSLNLAAQDDGSNDVGYRFFTGGNLGLGLGTITNIDVSPMIGYHILPYWSVGLGGTYQYYLDKRYPYDPVSLNIIGGRAFTRVYPIPQLMGHLEFEHLSYKTNLTLFPGMNPDERIHSNNLLAGVGYRQQVGMQAYSYIMILWNLNQTQYTPYTNPVFRVGFEIGLW